MAAAEVWAAARVGAAEAWVGGKAAEGAWVRDRGAVAVAKAWAGVAAKAAAWGEVEGEAAADEPGGPSAVFGSRLLYPRPGGMGQRCRRSLGS